MNTTRRILLGQLSSNGDCLYATAIARQIKSDFPGCHLTWAIGSAYRQVIDENPFVDDVWEILIPSRHEAEHAWRIFAREAREKKRNGEFDEIFLTQINPDNYGNFDGTVRASIFRGYPRPVTAPVTPVVRLTPTETAHVRHVVTSVGFDRYPHRVLFECASASSQSFVTPEFAQQTAQLVVNRLGNAAFILSSNLPIGSSDPRIVDGSTLSFRENAELTKYCTLFIGCSSGITWIATSDWAMRLPMIQLLKRETFVFASVLHDAEHFGLPTEHILEMTDCTPAHLADCIVAVLNESFASARARFHEQIPVRLDFYFKRFIRSQLIARHFRAVLGSFRCVVQRYGLRPFWLFLLTILSFGALPRPVGRAGPSGSGNKR